jgi:hypothetical protein
MKIRPFLLITNLMIIMTLSIFIDLAFAEEYTIDVLVIEKPKWCNSASISYYSTLIEFQEEYKYPCVKYMSDYL